MCSTSFQEQLETRASAATPAHEDPIVVSTTRWPEGLAVAAAEEAEAAGFFVDFPPFFFFASAAGAEGGGAAAGEARGEGSERASKGADSSPAPGESDDE